MFVYDVEARNASLAAVAEGDAGGAHGAVADLAVAGQRLDFCGRVIRERGSVSLGSARVGTPGDVEGRRWDTQAADISPVASVSPSTRPGGRSR